MEGELDDAFNKYIEVVDEKENTDCENIQVSIKQPKTSPEQYNRIGVFFEEYNEELIDKASFDGLWEKLACELNDMGPPKHTVPQWKKKWSDYKYNKNKRKKSIEDREKDKISLVDQPSNFERLFEKLGDISDKLDRVGSVEDKLNAISRKQDAIISLLENSNLLKNDC